MGRPKINIKGQRFERLIAIRPTKKRSSGGHVIWSCLCDRRFFGCGKKVEVSSDRWGITKSCGCLRDELTGKRFTTHGKTKTPEWRVWKDMKGRCHNPKCKDYKYYGGRGIRVCRRWRNSFENFLKDMGERPSPELTLERINNDGNYKPSNCKWATWTEQANNKRKRK